mgnify:CR=1 FL=1
MYNFGSIVLVPFPFTDLTASKLRPALIVSKKSNNSDIMVAFISSQLNRKGLVIKSDRAEFHSSGLKIESMIRFDKIATLDKKIILGELGILPVEFLQKNARYFFDEFGFDK